MPSKKPQRADKDGAVQRFKVVQQSYEDKDYEEAPKPVLVEVEKRKKRTRHEQEYDDDAAAAEFFGDAPTMKKEDFSNKRNMLMADDTNEYDAEEEKLFDDEVEEDFDQDFIQQMMYGEPAEGEGGEEDDDDDEFGDKDQVEYPKHDVTKRALDRQFARAMREFNADEALNDPEVEDPRLQGALDVHQYAAALEEFVEGKAGMAFGMDKPQKNAGLLHQMQHMSTQHRIFDSTTDGGVFMTVLPHKKTRENSDFQAEVEELRKITLERVRSEKAATDAALAAAGVTDDHEDEKDDEQPEQETQEKEMEVVAVPQNQRVDCETVLSTYSTLYNHPNIIAAQRKKMDPKYAARVAQRALRARHLERLQEEQRDEEVEEEEEEEDPLAGVDLSERPKDETKEEKQLRRQLVKQLQKERRQGKKTVKSAYKAAHLDRSAVAPVAKQQKAQKSLSLFRGSAS